LFDHKADVRSERRRKDHYQRRTGGVRKELAMASNDPTASAIAVSALEPARSNNSSGRGMFADVPAGVRGWNWGAFLLGWIWGIKNRTWVALWTLIPIVAIPVMFVLGAKGSEWAWRNRQWESVDGFKRTQRRWSWYGLIVLILAVGLWIATRLIGTGASA
jgi:hypothetical protein